MLDFMQRFYSYTVNIRSSYKCNSGAELLKEKSLIFRNNANDALIKRSIKKVDAWFTIKDVRCTAKGDKSKDTIIDVEIRNELIQEKSSH